MSTIGEDFRKQRELKHITLEDAARNTKISLRYLRALEENRHDILPGAAYTKAYIHIYAVYMGLDAEDMTRRYYGMNAPKISEEMTSEVGAAAPEENRAISPILLVAGVALPVAAAVLFFFFRQNLPQWAAWLDRSITSSDREVLAAKSDEPPAASLPVVTRKPADTPPPETPVTPPSEPIVDSGATPAKAATMSKELPTETAADVAGAFGVKESLPPPEPERRREEMAMAMVTASSLVPAVMNLEVSANSQCWVEGYIDKERLVGRTMDMGQKVDLQAHDKFLLTLGSAGAVDLRLNGHSMKRVGKLGEVKRITITADNYRELLE